MLKCVKLLVAFLTLFAVCGHSKAAEANADSPEAVVRKYFAAFGNFDFDTAAKISTGEAAKQVAKGRKIFASYTAAERERRKAAAKKAAAKAAKINVESSEITEVAILILSVESEKEKGRAILKKIDGTWKLYHIGAAPKTPSKKK